LIRNGKRRIPILLAAATLIPIGVLSWLGVRILQQDREVERQRARETLEVDAGRLALAIARQLEDVEERLTHGAGIHFTPTGMKANADISLLYQPSVSAAERLPAAFQTAESEEFQRQDLAAAAAAYQRLAETREPEVRAAALVRLGRVLRKRGDRTGALQAYTKLGELGPLTVAGEPAEPAELIARQGRAKIFEDTGSPEDLRREAADLAHVLYAGGWEMDRATFDVYRDLLQHWGAPALPPSAIAGTEAAIDLWNSWRDGNLPVRGRRFLHKEGGPILAVWAGGPEHPAAWLATSDQLETFLRPTVEAQHLTVSLFDIDGQPVFGDSHMDGIPLTPGETHLPFILKVASAGASADASRDRMRRTVLISGLTMAFLLTIAAAYGLYRATTRELLIARQQSDFVSAVSHEFRTPLTSMRHLTDLLVSRGVQSEERKAQYYELLAHETERLHRMVESLLSFGRIEAGAYAWHLEPAEVGELVRDVVDEFRRDPQAEGRQIVCEIEEPLPIRADREALARALWNLLENAGKYSPAGAPIRVFARRQSEALLLSVEDEGAGIAPSEREKVFQKFVRGADAIHAGIRGVGIGLALVQRIVEAHGGSVRLESEPGRGSTFTLVLPCPEF